MSARNRCDARKQSRLFMFLHALPSAARLYFESRAQAKRTCISLSHLDAHLLEDIGCGSIREQRDSFEARWRREIDLMNK